MKSKILRRDKTDPASDMWHVLRVGLVVFVVAIVPGLFVAEWQLMPTPQERVREWIHEHIAEIQKGIPQ